MQKTYKTFFLGSVLAMMAGLPMAGHCLTTDEIKSVVEIATTINKEQTKGMPGVVSTPTGTNSSNGCDDESNDRIIAELALCSTHAYNIAQTTNPSDATNKQLMRDVVALKTTVMTQQMDKQYEYMDAMLRRFKTQLEKAILTTKLQAAGATTTTESSNSSYSGGLTYAGTSGGTGNVRNQTPGQFIEGASNCEIIFEPSELYKCLADNHQKIYEQSKGGQTVSRELRQQLANDFKVLSKNEAGITLQPTQSYQLQGCQDESRMSSDRSLFQTCLSAHITNIRNANTAYNQSNKQPSK